MALTDRTVVLVASTRKCITGLCSKTCRHCSSLARGASAAPSWLFISAISRFICSATMPAAWRSPLQIHAADFDAGLAALLAADPLTTSAIQIAFCGSVERLALVLRKEHQSQKLEPPFQPGRHKPLTVKRDTSLPRGTKQLIQRSLPEPRGSPTRFPRTILSCSCPHKMGNPPATPRSTRRLAVYGVNPPHRAGEIRRAELGRRAGNIAGPARPVCGKIHTLMLIRRACGKGRARIFRR